MMPQAIEVINAQQAFCPAFDAVSKCFRQSAKEFIQTIRKASETGERAARELRELKDDAANVLAVRLQPIEKFSPQEVSVEKILVALALHSSISRMFGEHRSGDHFGCLESKLERRRHLREEFLPERLGIELVE